MNATRRGFMASLAGLAGGVDVVGAQGSSTIDVGVYVSVEAECSTEYNDFGTFCQNVQSELERVWPDADVVVEYEGVRQIPDEAKDSRRAALRYCDNYLQLHTDSNLLILSNEATENWETGGRAQVGGTAAVCRGGEAMGINRYRTWLALHEIGHNLGLRHHDGEVREEDGKRVRTVMSGGEADDHTTEFSESAVRKLRRIN